MCRWRPPLRQFSALIRAAEVKLPPQMRTSPSTVPRIPRLIGSFISLYATGEGQTSPQGIHRQIGGATSTLPTLPVFVTIGGIPATVQYAGGAPGEVAGVMQVNAQIPPGVQP